MVCMLNKMPPCEMATTNVEWIDDNPKIEEAKANRFENLK